MDLRALLAVVLGVLLGFVFLAFPEGVVRVQALGRTQRRRGPYGEDGDFPRRWTLLVRLIGVACLVVAGVVAVDAV